MMDRRTFLKRFGALGLFGGFLFTPLADKVKAKINGIRYRKENRTGTGDFIGLVTEAYEINGVPFCEVLLSGTHYYHCSSGSEIDVGDAVFLDKDAKVYSFRRFS